MSSQYVGNLLLDREEVYRANRRWVSGPQDDTSQVESRKPNAPQARLWPINQPEESSAVEREKDCSPGASTSAETLLRANSATGREPLPKTFQKEVPHAGLSASDPDRGIKLHMIPRTLVFSISGKYSYDQVVDLCFSIGRRWRPRMERLVLDFSGIESVDAEALRFMAGELNRIARDAEDGVCVVRVPARARRLFSASTHGNPLRLVNTIEEAVLG